MNTFSRFGVHPSILMYHSIAEGSGDPYAVSPSSFRDQVSWLLEHQFEPVSLSVLVSLLKKSDFQGLMRKVVFTFDDGYSDFMTDALPILLRNGVPATIFIIPGMLGEKASWSGHSKNVRLMNESEIRKVRAHGISIGSHTMTHENLTTLCHEDLHRQLVDSQAKLRDLGESFYALSYPWGKFMSGTLSVAKATGYDCAVTVGGEMRPGRVNIYRLPRMTMRADLDLGSFQALFDGPVVKGIRRVGRVLKKYFIATRGDRHRAHDSKLTTITD